jgi:hypothetical protein
MLGRLLEVVACRGRSIRAPVALRRELEISLLRRAESDFKGAISRDPSLLRGLGETIGETHEEISHS